MPKAEQVCSCAFACVLMVVVLDGFEFGALMVFAFFSGLQAHRCRFSSDRNIWSSLLPVF